MSITKKILLDHVSVNTSKTISAPITEDTFEETVLKNVEQIKIGLEAVFFINNFKSRAQFLSVLCIERGKLGVFLQY